LKKLFQYFVLQLYRFAKWTGALDTRIGKSISNLFYSLYKKVLETNIDHLRIYVPQNTNIIDVGANVGYFSIQFAKWVSGNGRVFAIEPEQANFDTLVSALKQKNITCVDPILAAAVDHNGVAFLQLNPLNPADHRIGTTGIQIPAITLDSLANSTNHLPVSFIKIDVQGAELMVLKGATEILHRWNPVLFIEIDEPSLNNLGTSSEELIDFIASFGYTMHAATGQGITSALSKAQAAQERLKLGYADFVFLPSSSQNKLG
jgi:FkbM family methyltransferase